jgi:hypothetical protein
MVATPSTFEPLLTMKNERVVLTIMACSLALGLSIYVNAAPTVRKNEHLIKNFNNYIDTMRVRDLIILAKYAQGAIVFNSFLEHVRHMKSDERKEFLSQIVELIKKLEPEHSDAATAIKKSEFNTDCKHSLVLREGVNDQSLEELLKFPDTDIEPTFKLLLNLFAEGYKRAYVKNRNNATKFWYWDYSVPSTSFQIIELDTNQEIDISNF